LVKEERGSARSLWVPGSHTLFGNISKTLLLVLLCSLIIHSPVSAQTSNTENPVSILFMAFRGDNAEEAQNLGAAMRTNLEYRLQGTGYVLAPSSHILTVTSPTLNLLSTEDQAKNPHYLINGVLSRKDEVTVVDITLWDLKAKSPALFFSQTFGYERFEEALTIVPFYSGSLILPLLEMALEELTEEHGAALAELERLRPIQQDRADAGPPATLPADEPPVLPPAAPPENPTEQAFIFSPHIALSSGFQIFFPGPKGTFSDDIRLQNEYYPTGSAFFIGNVSKSLGFIVGFERDSITMNRFFTRVSWDIDFIGIEAGPYLGLFNPDARHVSIGVSLLLRLGVPRWGVFTSFQLDTPILRELSEPGDHNQSFNQINLGYAFSLFRIVLSMTTRASTLETVQWISVTNHWIRYNLDLEISPPRIPLKFRLNSGYQELRWTYNIPLAPFEYRYQDLYIGIAGAYTKSSWTFFLGIEAPVYPFRYGDLGSLQDPQASFFGQFTLGLQWTPHIK
jgi:hypothetical protein